MIFQGIRTSIAKEPYSFVIFQGGGGGGSGPSVCTSGSAHVSATWIIIVLVNRVDHDEMCMSCE